MASERATSNSFLRTETVRCQWQDYQAMHKISMEHLWTSFSTQPNMAIRLLRFSSENPARSYHFRSNPPRFLSLHRPQTSFRIPHSGNTLLTEQPPQSMSRLEIPRSKKCSTPIRTSIILRTLESTRLSKSSPQEWTWDFQTGWILPLSAIVRLELQNQRPST